MDNLIHCRIQYWQVTKVRVWRTPKLEPQGTPKLEPQGTPKLEPQGTSKLEPQGTPKLEHRGTPKLEGWLSEIFKGTPKRYQNLILWMCGIFTPNLEVHNVLIPPIISKTKLVSVPFLFFSLFTTNFTVTSPFKMKTPLSSLQNFRQSYRSYLIWKCLILPLVKPLPYNYYTVWLMEIFCKPLGGVLIKKRSRNREIGGKGYRLSAWITKIHLWTFTCNSMSQFCAVCNCRLSRHIFYSHMTVKNTT